MNIIALQHDYLTLSLSSLRQETVVRVLDIRVVEGLQGLLVTEEEFSTAAVVDTEPQELLAGEVVEEQSLSATVETEDMAASMTQIDDMAAVFEECDT
jgi:hypothetical protein